MSKNFRYRYYFEWHICILLRLIISELNIWYLFQSGVWRPAEWRHDLHRSYIARDVLRQLSGQPFDLQFYER